MLLSNQPTKVQVPFANSGTKNTIPVASQIGITAGAASYTDGFPPLTFTPIASGGVPPSGADFNGIFNAITSILRWQSGGGHFTYDSAWATANGGYPKGALLLKADGSGFWLNTSDGNTVNPDTVGTNWIDLIPYASSATTQAGTSTTQVVTPKGLADSMFGGAGQTWQDVTASRAVGTTYTNTTGRPIAIAFRFGTTGTARLAVGGTPVSDTSSTGSTVTAYAVVPAGQTYQVTATSGTVTMSGWTELR